MANIQAMTPDLAPPKWQKPRSVSANATILGGATIALVILFVGGWLSFCFRRKLCAYFRLYWNQKGDMNAEKLKLRRFSLVELQRATNNFGKECIVGSGAFGNIYRGTFPVEGELAIKRPRAALYTSTEEFRNEVRLLSKVNHENLVRLVGFCEETGPKAAKILVYEYVTNGSLLDYMMGRGGKNLTWRQRVNIAIGAAKGIAHLHEGIIPSIIHRDIKPSNILIGEGYEAKVSDFGLVKSGPVGDESHVSSMIKGTPGYLDPAYCSSFHLTTFTDVYSFGVILLQLIAAKPAVGSTRTIGANSHIIDWAKPSIEKGSIEEIMDTNLLTEESCNMEAMLKMGQIAVRCVAKVPRERPTMTRVWQELESALNLADSLLPKHLDAIDSQQSTSIFNQSATRSIRQSSMIDDEYSQSIVSVDGIGLQRFHVDMDSVSFQSASLRCLETSINMDDHYSVPGK